MPYVVRNCPAFAKGIFCKGGDIIDDGCADKTLDRNTLISCQDRTDCIMKQIVELCKENLNSLENYIDVRSFECVILQNILKLLDIQEVE